MFPRTCPSSAMAKSVSNASSSKRLAPTLIAAGLLILLSATLWPGVPAVSGMALVALGATSATLSRFRTGASLLPILFAHIGIYGSLYALFVGATLHAAAARSASGLDILEILDLALSIGPLAVAIELIGCELHARHSAE